MPHFEALDLIQQREEELSMQLYDLCQIAGHLMNLADDMGIHPVDFSRTDIPDIHTIYKRLSDMQDEAFKRKLRCE